MAISYLSTSEDVPFLKRLTMKPTVSIVTEDYSVGNIFFIGYTPSILTSVRYPYPIDSVNYGTVNVIFVDEVIPNIAGPLVICSSFLDTPEFLWS